MLLTLLLIVLSGIASIHAPAPPPPPTVTITSGETNVVLSAQDVNLTRLTYSSFRDYNKPYGVPYLGLNSASAWCSVAAVGEWVQVNFVTPVVLYGMKTKGLNGGGNDNFVKTLTVSYSLVSNAALLSFPDFTTNTDADTEKQITFPSHPTVVSVRFTVKTYDTRPCLRLGIQTGDGTTEINTFSSTQVIVSSIKSVSNQGPSALKLVQTNNDHAWCGVTNTNQWVQLDFDTIPRVVGICIHGKDHSNEHADDVEVSRLDENNQWSVVGKFSGNKDGTSFKAIKFDK